MKPNILLVDIETAPLKAYTWGIWQQNIGINQIREPGYTLCWAAKWLGEDSMMFSSVHGDGKKKMVRQIHQLVNKADVVVHYNGTKFDMPILNQEFLQQKLGPPSPHIDIDLLRTVKQRFRFPSNKLDYVARVLKREGKVKNRGMDLWTECMAGDDAAWIEMEEYNRKDVTLLEDVYHDLLPWIKNHPNVALWDVEQEDKQCPQCGSTSIQKRGMAYTKTMVYQRYHCQSCGAWSKARTNNLPLEKKSNILVGI